MQFYRARIHSHKYQHIHAPSTCTHRHFVCVCVGENFLIFILHNFVFATNCFVLFVTKVFRTTLHIYAVSNRCMCLCSLVRMFRCAWETTTMTLELNTSVGSGISTTFFACIELPRSRNYLCHSNRKKQIKSYIRFFDGHSTQLCLFLYKYIYKFIYVGSPQALHEGMPSS